MDLLQMIRKYKLSKENEAELISYISNRYDSAEKIEISNRNNLDLWDDILCYGKIFGYSDAVNTKLCPRYPVKFMSPSDVDIIIYNSFAGKIPILYVKDTNDFEHLVTNIVYNGERPDNISKTGASFVFGKTVCFIILSSKPYSNVSNEELGIDAEEWREKSMLLRRDHECTHYFTQQRYGIAENRLHDEVMADFIGMYNAFGFYKAEWFLRFMGIIKGGGDRMVYYTKDMTPQVREAVAQILSQVAYMLEKWTQTSGFKAMSNAERVDVMCKKGLKGMLNMCNNAV